MKDSLAFGQFVSINETDASELVQRMSSDDLPVAGDRYGVVTRLIARPSVGVADLAQAAVAKLLCTTALEPSQLGALVLSSRIPDPTSAARQVADQLDLRCPAHGIERACSGFPAAIGLAMQLCQKAHKPVAVITAEIISRSVNWEPANGDLSDQHRARGQAAKLFADGAAAVIVGPLSTICPHEILDAWHGEVADEQQLIQKTDVEAAMDPWGEVRTGLTTCMTMPGRRGLWLVKRAPQLMLEAVRKSVENAQQAGRLADEERVLHIVPHQANGLILSRLQHLIDETGGDVRVWNGIANSGNTVSASIPLAMAQVQQQLPPQSIVAMPSVGAGGPGYRPDVLSTGCVLARIRKEPKP